jgi:hypothetical protein
VRGEKKTLRSFKGQRVKEASSLRFFLDKKSHPPAAREATRGARKKKRERKKRGFYSQRAALTSSRGHASLFLSSITKKNVDDDE